MGTRRISLVLAVTMVATGLSSAWAFVVSDAATTTRNAVTAVLKNTILDTLTAQLERLELMAARLSALTNLTKYATEGSPAWATHDPDVVAFLRALNDGDPTGVDYERVARSRQPVTLDMASLPPTEREAIERALATLDLADSTIITGAHQTGVLRHSGELEWQAVNKLEADVLNPSQAQSTTAVLDKMSGAALIEARQKQARIQFLTAAVEQLLVDNKRARDTEAAALNMRLGQLRQHGGEEGGLMTGAADDLRNWRQP
jgi:hypothetical protein